MIWYKQNDEITLCPSSTLRGVIVGKCQVTFVFQLLRLYQIIYFGWMYFIFSSNCPTYIWSMIWGFEIDNSKIKRSHRPFNQISKQGQFPHQRIAIIWGQDEVVNVENGSAGKPDLEEKNYIYSIILCTCWFSISSGLATIKNNKTIGLPHSL